MNRNDEVTPEEHEALMADLAAAGGPSLAEIRQDVVEGKTIPLAEARRQLLGDQ